MKSFLLTVLGNVFTFFILTAQPNLLPHIGIEEEPEPETPICEIPTYLGTFDVTGYMMDEFVADFSLHTPEGERFTLSDVLDAEKPVLLVAASYTCWRYRDQIANINAVANYYEDDIETFIVYTVEAHPHISISPYSGEVWTGQRNFTENVLYEQPTTYGERLEVIADMQSEFGIVPEILVDGPCNEWWSHYGPSPNNAYLIDLDGRVQMKHAWLNSYPDDLWCDISDYLHDDNENCNEAGLNGSFEVTYDLPEGNTAYGSPGEVLTISTTIQNLSETDNVEVDIIREEVYVQPDWSTALCVDVCYNSLVSNATVTIPPGGSQSFIFYFYTGGTEGVGSASVRFENAYFPSNFEILDFQGVTDVSTGIEDHYSTEVNLYPNPASDFLQMEVSEQLIGLSARIHSITGAVVLDENINATHQRWDISALSPGVYFVQFNEANQEVQRFVVE